MAQDDVFSKLPQASLDGVVFPVQSIKIRSGSTVAFHRFPHRPGQKAEFMGRDPLMGAMVAPMFSTLPFEGNGSNAFWPDGIELLREKVQLQKPLPLVIPVYGTIQRAVVTLEEDYTAQARDGCYATLSFSEVTDELVSKGKVSARGKIQRVAKDLDNELAALRIALADRADLLEGGLAPDFATMVNGFLAALDQADQTLADRMTQMNRIVGAIDAVFDRAAGLLSDPSNWAARDAALELKLGVSDAVTEALGGARPIKGFTTAAAMTALDVATATKNTVAEILSLNALNDASDIPAGELLLVYAT